MSRIGKKPVTLPDGVDVTISGHNVSIKGKKGQLEYNINDGMTVKVEGDQLIVERSNDEPSSKAIHGLTRSLLSNMVSGVTEEFSKELELQGVGYRAALQGKELQLSVGRMGVGGKPYISVTPPPGISFEVDGNTKIIVKGIDKQQVGQIAAEVRAVRPPEPYKGKGIRYVDEYVRKKAGKTAAAAAA